MRTPSGNWTTIPLRPMVSGTRCRHPICPLSSRRFSVRRRYSLNTCPSTLLTMPYPTPGQPDYRPGFPLSLEELARAQHQAADAWQVDISGAIGGATGGTAAGIAVIQPVPSLWARITAISSDGLYSWQQAQIDPHTGWLDVN